MRAFIAVTLPEDARTLLEEVCRLLREDAPQWRSEKWVPALNSHLTLRFLGAVPEASIESLVRRTWSATRGMLPFTWRLEQVRAVPDRHGARMLWTVPAPESAGVELAARLAGVGGGVSESTSSGNRGDGSRGREQQFMPHITLCRAREQRVLPADALKRANAIVAEARCSVSVKAVTLFASELTRSGPRYVEVAVVRFDGD